jgi:diacylglycerol kinase (ATP)
MKAFFKSFIYAGQGLRFAWTGINFRVQTAAAIMVIAAGFFFKIQPYEWLAVVLITGLVLAAEILNTSIEHVVNLISPDIHPLAGKIKDLAAGAVLVLAMTSIVIGLIIFVPYIIAFAYEFSR